MKRYFLCTMVISALFTSFAFAATPAAQTSILTVTQGTPNPYGSLDEVYLIKGERLDGKIVLSDDENLLPKKSENSDDTLYIYHMNDMHGNIMKYSSKGDTHNLAQMKKIVDTAKTTVNEKSSTIWVTAGDDHIGSKLDELLGNDETSFVMSASYEAYSKAGVDFAALGNHEFDKLTPILARAINENAQFPVIASNIFGSKYNLNTSVAAIGVSDGLRIGVIGLTIPEETKLQTSVDKDLTAIDPMEALEKLVPALEDYCDFLMVISHNGYEQSDRYTIRSGDAALAEKISSLTSLPSVIVGGHTHTTLNADSLQMENVYDGIPIVHASQHGNYLGKFYAYLGTKTPKYNARLLPIVSGVKSSTSTLVETEDMYDTAFQTSVIDPMNALVEETMKTVVGYTDDTALLTKETNHVDRYIGESAIANYLNDAIVKRSESYPTGKADFSIFNATGISGLEKNSEITFNDIYNLFPYADTISIVTMTGADLKSIIENNAPRILDEKDLTANGGKLDPNSFIEIGYLNFSSGIRYEIKDKQAINITLNGKNIEDVLTQEYKVALNSYLMIGRGGWQGNAVGQGLPEDFIGFDLKTLCNEKGTDLGLLFRGEIVNYITEDCGGKISAETGVLKDGRVVVLP